MYSWQNGNVCFLESTLRNVVVFAFAGPTVREAIAERVGELNDAANRLKAG